MPMQSVNHSEDENKNHQGEDAGQGRSSVVIPKDSSERAALRRAMLSKNTLRRIRGWASDGRASIDSLVVRDLLSHADSQRQYLNDITQIADVGSAAEFGDALERIETISSLLNPITQANDDCK